MKRIILCADDYGQTSAISQAIIELIQLKRLSATSCMTNSPLWQAHATWLKSCNTVDVGLHFNLTEGYALSNAMVKTALFSLPQILFKSHFNQLDKSAITVELHAQIDAFYQGMGRLPDFIDGHQHIHHMPVIRDIVINVFRERLQANGAYIRCVYDAELRMRQASLKKLLIQYSGAIAFKKQLLAIKIPHNTSFSGIYAFSKSNQYQQLFKQFISKITNNGIIMCHPGLADSLKSNIIRTARYDEYRYLKSDDFARDCAQNHIYIDRFSEV